MSLISKLRNRKGSQTTELDVLRVVAKRLGQQNELLTKQHAETMRMLGQLETQTRLMDGMRNAALHPLREELYESMRGRHLSMFETLDAVRADRLGLARFGDGELRLAFYPDFDIKFQPNSPALRSELMGILEDRSLPVMLTLPEPSRDRFWTDFWANHWHRIRHILDHQPRWGHTQVTRREFFGTYGADAVEAWRTVWAGRDALLVAGTGSRFEMIDALFGSLNSIERMDAPPTDAYSEIDAIERGIVDRKPDLVLLALGPSGTVLAHRLARHGIQALDIGHITAVWRQVFEGAGSPESLPAAR